METPDPNTLLILTGFFQEGVNYHTTRSKGSGDWLLIYTCAGSGIIKQGGIHTLTYSGDVLLIRPHTPHDYGTNLEIGKWALYWAHFHPRPDWIDWMGWPECAPGVMKVSLTENAVRDQVAHSLQDMHHLNSGALAQRDQFAMNALENVILWINTLRPHAGQGMIDSRVRDCMEYIARNLAEPLTLNLLAAQVKLSSSRLSHLFSGQVGMSPMQFLENRRIQRASELLTVTERSITQISSEIGYENPFYFTLRFKRLIGVPPSVYRQRSK